MELKLVFSLFGMLLSLGAFLHYFWSIKRGETKPHVYTWLIFSLLLTPSYFIQVANGGWFGTYVLLIELLGCISVFLLALKYGEKHITVSDKVFLGWAIITIFAWLIFKAPYISTCLIIIIDFFALLPTYRKCYMKPHEETIIMYLISGGIFLSSLLAIEHYSFLTMGHQISIILFDWGLVLFILLRRKILKK